MKLWHRTTVEIVVLLLLVAVGFKWAQSHAAPPSPQLPVLKQIQQAYQEKQYVLCETLCRGQLVQEPGDLTLTRWLGMAQREQGNIEGARHTFDDAISSVQTPAKWLLFPQRLANLHRERGNLLRKTQGLKAAHSDYAAATELLQSDGSTEDAELCNLEGMSNYAAKLNKSEALPRFMEARSVNPDEPRYQVHIDRCQSISKDSCGESDCILCRDESP
jgi:tetratricopeptide (TPR) repeat protein